MSGIAKQNKSAKDIIFTTTSLYSCFKSKVNLKIISLETIYFPTVANDSITAATKSIRETLLEKKESTLTTKKKTKNVVNTKLHQN